MASDTDLGDDLAYLHPDFDRNSLTVPRLRSILVNHDVPYPASAKKAQLVSILESEVMPRAKKLLRERERVRRTSKGITNMPSNNNSQEEQGQEHHHVPEDHGGRRSGPGHDEGYDHVSPVTPSSTTARRGRSSRPSTRASTATSVSEIEDTAPRSSRQRASRTPVVQKHPRASDTEETGEDVVPSIEQYSRKTPGKKSRKSEFSVTPQMGSYHRESAVPEQREPSPVRRHRESSVFTDDNPFQSGSSPMAEETPRARTSGGRSSRRTSKRPSETTSTVAASKSGDRRRRKTSEPVHVKQEEDVEVPSRSTFDVSGIKAEEESDEEEEEADFSAGQLTPDAEGQEEMDVGYHRSRQPTSSGSYASWIVILTLLGAFAAWWRQEKVEIGYCGVGKPRWSLVDTNVPDWADAIEPQCETCPQHAFCYPNLEVKCEPDFVLKPHPLSLGGLVPVPPTCEPDGEKVRRVKVVADKAIEELRERRAKWECGEPEKEDGSISGEVPPSPELTIAELKEQVNKLRRKGMTDDEFEELWRGAMAEIAGREEVVSNTKGPSSSDRVTSFSSTSLAHLSFSCAIRRHLRLSILAYRLPLLVLAVIAAAAGYTRSRVLARRADAARVPALVGMTLDRLATQAALHTRGEAREPWIAVGQLRDDVLRDELRGSRREKLWTRVRAVVEGNANVRAAVREGRGGDVARVWEWIGGFAGIEWADGSSPYSYDGDARRESGRVRFAQDSPSHAPVSGSRAPNAEKMEVRKWDEGRPVY